MKPNFALTLSFEGIGLLHRAFPGWHLVGEIGLDNGNLLADLRALRDKAASLDPSGLRSKLVIPNDQIRYISFDAGDAAPEDLPDIVRRKLDGATPYALEDLVYDWSDDDDGTVKVAAVARETLREAEAFAKEHRFNPISFVAIPESGSFAGEPFFGETAHFRATAGPGETVELDPVPVRIIGTAKLPEPDPVPEPDDDEGGEDEVAGNSAVTSEVVLPDEPEAETVAETVAEMEPERETAPEPEMEPEPETLSGFSDPPAAFEAPVLTDDKLPGSDAADEAEDARPADPVTTEFTSIRAQRGAAPATAPKLDGVARHFTPVPVSVQVNAESLPRDRKARPRPRWRTKRRTRPGSATGPPIRNRPASPRPLPNPNRLPRRIILTSPPAR